MLLTPSNSTNPAFWGKEIRFYGNSIYDIGKMYRDMIPNECDFINAFFPKNPQGAREYFRFN